MKNLVYTIIMLFVCSLSALAENKHALVIGLGVQKDASWAKINGDKDAALVVDMLKENGFRDIITCINEKATKQNMAQSFLDLSKRCKPGDVVYIHYSGHGQLMTDVDGDEASRWTGKHSKFDESWIPYDAYMKYCDNDHGEKHFCDDEIARYLTMLRQRVGKKGQIIVVVDACHSGDATRGNDDEPVRGVDVEFIIPRQLGINPAIPLAEKWLTISACKPYQLSFEQNNPVGGKITFALCQLGSKIFTMSNEELQQALQRYIDLHPGRLPQNPMVSGKKQ